MEKKRLLHDINSNISALTQAIELLDRNWKKDEVTVIAELLPLMVGKIDQLNSDWQKLKNKICR